VVRWFRNGWVAVGVAAVIAGGCASSSVPETGGGATPRAAVQRYIDQDDCAVVTDRFAELRYPGPDPRAACSRDRDSGWNAGEYRVVSTDVDGDVAFVVAEQLGVRRTYDLVRGSSGWHIDGVLVEHGTRRARLGRSLATEDDWTMDDGRDLDVRLVVTVRDLEARQTSATECEAIAKVRMRSRSDDSITLRSSDFALVDTERKMTRGTQWQGAAPAIAPGETISVKVGFTVPCATNVAAVAFSFNGEGQILAWSL
jgi:hypothetical protein